LTAVDTLPTPAVLVDLDRVERNIAAMAERARAAGVKLRPHAKTHKVLEIARLQRAAGAAGLTVAKTSEAEVFAGAGFDDLFLAFPVVGADKGRRLLALADRVRLAVGVDSVEGARTLAGVFHDASRTLDVMLKVDVGFRRVGVEPAAASDCARRIADLPGLRLRGVFTFAGHSYSGETPGAVADVGRAEGEILSGVGQALARDGLGPLEVSVGSTPTARHAMTVAGVTECRPGNYVYNDASQVSLGTCGLDDCGLTVAATVVSVPAPDRAVLDAGSKTLSTDPLRPRAEGYGWILGGKSRLARLSEEHGVVDVAPGETFRVGQRVRVLPNHSCVVANLHDFVTAVRGDRVEGRLRVAARGCVE
jgi:D-serine deaminase-like pyridoxal phosphate-dependent protein